jgi:hypothetical protein
MKKYLFAAVIVAACYSCGGGAQKEALFNGKDLSNWNFVVKDDAVPAGQVYSVEDGTILIQGAPFGYMYTKKKYGNGVLEVEWRWVDAATNSGIFLLIEDPKNPFPNGIECQLHAGDAGDLVLLGGSDLAEFKLPEGQERPEFPVVRKQNASSEKETGQWNRAEIHVKDGLITVHINGTLQNSGTNRVKEGYIGLQSEGSKIQFRNVTFTPEK